MSKDLEKELKKIIEEYGDEIGEEIEKITNEVAKKSVELLKANSPKKSGKYGQSWKAEDGETSAKRKTKIIRNEKHYRLTHLLEWGHAKVNGGRVSSRPHIQKVEQEAIKQYEERIKRAIEK